MIKNMHTIKTKEKGAILITSLVMLTVLTLLGLSGMSGYVLEQRMAGNHKQRQIGFQSAEAVVREGEIWLTTNITSLAQLNTHFGGSHTTGLYSLRPTEPGAFEKTLDFSTHDDAAWKSYGLPATGASNLPEQPRYIIEYLGRTRISAGNTVMHNLDPLDPNSKQPDMREHAFRITGIGWGYDEKARQILQSSIRIPL